jgi:hypothetical protein
MFGFRSSSVQLKRRSPRLSLEQLEDRSVPAIVFAENFDNVTPPNLPPGWSSTAAGGNVVPWATSTTIPFSSPNAAFSGNAGTLPGDSFLFSPVISINGLNPMLRFQNFYDLENGFEGYQLDVSVNRGPFRQVTTVGAVFRAGGYTGTISTGFSSSIGGQLAWTGNSGGGVISTYESCVVDFSNVAGVVFGSTIQFRWHFAADLAVNSPGCRIDNVSLDVTPLNTGERFAVGAGPGADPRVNVYDSSGQILTTFQAYSPLFNGGVRVATGDITNDGVDDIITAPGPGGGPHVLAFDGVTFGLIRSFFAYDPALAGGVNVTVGDVDNDGFGDIITAPAGGGGPHVQAFSGRTSGLIASFFAFDPSTTFGVNISSGGDFNGDGVDDIVTGNGTGGAPAVNIFDRSGNMLSSFFAYDPSFNGGVTVALGDLNGDKIADIATGTQIGNPHVIVIDGKTGQQIFTTFAYAPLFGGGVNLTMTDFDNDGTLELLTGAGIGSSGHIRRFLGNGTPFASFFAFEFSFFGGGFVG